MSIAHTPLAASALAELLSVRDLTDPGSGPHAIQTVLDEVVDALTAAWGCEVRWVRRPPIVSVTDNYDRLRIDGDAISRDARYTRYLSHDVVLRTHSSAHIPAALADLARNPADDVLLVVPAMVYRRDSIDRLHSPTPHQADLWRIRRGPGLRQDDLEEMIRIVATTAAPGRHSRTIDATHPYTRQGREVEVADLGRWVEVAECGLAHPAVLDGAGLAGWTGLAMGIGLDRLVMLRKGIPDIRLLRSDDARVSSQMTDLTPYKAVSSQPPARRDVSVVIDPGDDDEIIGDRIRQTLGDDADCVEEVETLSVTPHADLPDVARDRLGIGPGHVNALLRVTLRHPTRTLTADEANDLRDRIIEAVDRGS